jgi:hypothetical protein
VKRMKLSRAIREGIKKDGVQVFGRLFERDPITQEIVGCCALGAALIAVGAQNGGALPSDRFPRLTKRLTKRPAPYKSTKWDGMNLQDMVVGLNDGKYWSREKIANWLERNGW